MPSVSEAVPGSGAPLRRAGYRCRRGRPRRVPAFCGALPFSYTDIPSERWESFAVLVLEGAYEATVSVAAPRETRERQRNGVARLVARAGD